MHGISNDYIYINCMEVTPERLSELSIEMSDRHTGVGGDGIILICPSDVADFKMRIFNADGSEAKMCGNGSRCVGKYVYDYGLTAPVDTSCGVIEMTAVSMGNPHGVVFVDSLDNVDVHGLGRELEIHSMWPDRANIEFAQINSPSEITMRVWERGSGETMACGTGACATAVAAALTGRTGDRVTVHLLGGDLEIYRNPDNSHIYMTGGATTVFEGVYERQS